MKKIILASKSVSRRKQLERLNVAFETADPNVSESEYKAKIHDHIELSKKLSALKARSISCKNIEAVVIGGDTIASFDEKILSKPKGKKEAAQQLRALSGKSHKIITSTVVSFNGNEYANTIVAHMKMRKLTPDQILRYIEIDNPLDSCGSYRIDALGITLFEEIVCEDYTAIIGLPLMWLTKILAEIELVIP